MITVDLLDRDSVLRDASSNPHLNNLEVNWKSLTRTVSGKVVGSSYNGSMAWIGVPYAVPSREIETWFPTRDPYPWKGIFRAVRKMPPFYQLSYDINPKKSSLVGCRDAFFLNIWSPYGVPEERRKAKYPVMIWVHGGGNRIGNANDYDGSILSASQGIVVVSVSYRIGVWGFFCHRSLRQKAENIWESTGNYGLGDIVSSIRWVINNIEGFGGDPSNITLAGVSSGATNILALSASPSLKGLFGKAIVMSGTPEFCSVEEAEGDDYSKGKTKPGRSFLLSSSNIADVLMGEFRSEGRSSKGLVGVNESSFLYEDLVGFSAENIICAQLLLCERSGSSFWGEPVPAPISDGLNILEYSREENISGGLVPDSLVIGCARHEISCIPPFYNNFSLNKVVSERGDFGDGVEKHFSVVDISGLAFVKYNVIGFVESLYSSSGIPVFVYVFDCDVLDPLPEVGGLRVGSTHGLDVLFLFQSKLLGKEYFQTSVVGVDDFSFRQISNKFMGYLSGFMVGNCSSAVPLSLNEMWPSWSESGRHVIVFGYSEGALSVRVVEDEVIAGSELVKLECERIFSRFGRDESFVVVDCISGLYRKGLIHCDEEFISSLEAIIEAQVSQGG